VEPSVLTEDAQRRRSLVHFDLCLDEAVARLRRDAGLDQEEASSNEEEQASPSASSLVGLGDQGYSIVDFDADIIESLWRKRSLSQWNRSAGDIHAGRQRHRRQSNVGELDFPSVRSAFDLDAYEFHRGLLHLHETR